MLHTVMQLSQQSRTTSYSTSFQPRRSWSMSTCSEIAKALEHCSRSCSSVSANPEPKPPRAKAARTSTGKPIFLAAVTASSMFVADWDTASRSLMSCSFCEKISRSSVAMMVSMDVPSTLQLYFSNTPARHSSMPTLSAVCPPMLTMMPSGRSLAMISSTTEGRIGRKYTLSGEARPMFLEVWTVAILGLIKMTSMFSSLSALIAWDPE